MLVQDILISVSIIFIAGRLTNVTCIPLSGSLID